MLSWATSIFSPSAPTVKEGVREQTPIENGGDVPESPMPNPCETGDLNQYNGSDEGGDSLSEIEVLRRRLAEERHRRELAEQQVRSLVESQPTTDSNSSQRLKRVDSLSHLHAMRDDGDQSPAPATDSDTITSWTEPIEMPRSYTYTTKSKGKRVSGSDQSGRGRLRVSPKRTHSDMSHSEGAESDSPSIPSPSLSAITPPMSHKPTTTPDSGGPVKKARRDSTPDQKKMIGQLFGDDDDDIVERVLEDSAGSVLSPPIGGFAHRSRGKPPPRAPGGDRDTSVSPSAGSSSSARTSLREPSPMYPVLNSASSSRSACSSSVYPVLKKPSARKIGKESQNNPEGSLPLDLGGSYEVIDSENDDLMSSSSRRPMSDIDDDSAYEVEDDDNGDDEWAVVPDTPPSSTKRAKLSKASQRKSATKSKSKPRASIARKLKSTPRTPAPRGKKKLPANRSEDAANADENKHDFSDNEPESQRFVQKEFETPLRDPQASSATPEKSSHTNKQLNNHESDDDCVFVGESPGPSRSGSVASIGGDSELTTPGSVSSGGRRRRSRRTQKTPTRFVSRVPPPDTDGSDHESTSVSSSSIAKDSAAKSNPESSGCASGDFHSPIPKPSRPKKGVNLDASVVSDFDVSLLSESDFEQQRDIERELQRERRVSTVSSRPVSPFTASGAEIAAAIVQQDDQRDSQNQSFMSEQANISFMSEQEPTESDFDSAQYEDDDEDGDSDFEIEDASAAAAAAAGEDGGKGVNGDNDSYGEPQSSSPLAASSSHKSPNKSSVADDADFDEEMEDFDSIKLFIPAAISARYPSLKRVAKDRGICDFPLRCLRHTTHIIFEGDFNTKNSKERRWSDRVEKGDLIRKSPQWILGADAKPAVDNDAQEEKTYDGNSQSALAAQETPAKSTASPRRRPPETVEVGQKFTRRSFMPASWKARLANEAKQATDAEASATASSSSSRRPIGRRSKALMTAVAKTGRSASGRRVRAPHVDVSDTETDSESLGELELQVDIDSDMEFDDHRKSLPKNLKGTNKKKPHAPNKAAPPAIARKNRGRRARGHVKRSSLDGLKVKTPDKNTAPEVSAPDIEELPAPVAPASNQSPKPDISQSASETNQEEDTVLAPRSSSLDRLRTKTPRKRVLQSKREAVFDDPNIDMNSSELGDALLASETKSDDNLPQNAAKKSGKSSPSSSSSSSSAGGAAPKSSSSLSMRSNRRASRSRSISNPRNPNVSSRSSSSSSTSSPAAAAGSAHPPTLSRSGSLAALPGLERALSRLHSQATKPKPSAASSFVAEAEAANDSKGKGTPRFLDKSGPRRPSVTKIVIARRRDRNRKKADKRVANSLKGLLSQMQK